MKLVDVTPTWRALLPAMLDIIANGQDAEAVSLMTGQFERMALAADLHNAALTARRQARDAAEGAIR